MNRIHFLSLDGLLENKTNHKPMVLVDVLPEESYKEGHIPGAINIPLEKLAKTAPHRLQKSDMIAVYCGGYACKASTKAAEALVDMGYIKTYDFKAGKNTWIQAGLELEKA